MTQPEAQRTRVLIAEDNRAVSAFMVMLLADAGYEAEATADGEEFLERIEHFNPAVVILDLMMPKIHGMEALRRLRANPATARVGVIICTARPYKADHDQARNLGAFEIVCKPFKREDLLGAVRRCLAGTPETIPARPAAEVEAAYLPQFEAGQPYYCLWGTRGSTPVSGQRFVRHGGNTSCLEVGLGEDMVIVDAGTGIRELGLKLAAEKPRRLHILITHTHWDHIQGFPFFAPAYLPGFELVIYGAPGFGKDLKSIFLGQLDRDYFPVQFEDMQAKIEFRLLEKAPLIIGPIEVSWEYTHHPAATLAFQMNFSGRRLAYVSDNEFLYGYVGSPRKIGLASEILAPHRALVNFLQGVDLLIGEAQYTNEEYLKKIGWGHSSLSNACLLAKLAEAKRWVVIHHDPLHDDPFLERKLNLTRQVLRQLGHPADVTHGYDGMTEFL